MSLLMDVAVIFSGLNAIILLGLLYVYCVGFRKIRSRFTMALIVFSVLLLLQNLMSVYAYVAMAAFFSEAILPYVVIIDVSEFGALCVLLWATLK